MVWLVWLVMWVREESDPTGGERPRVISAMFGVGESIFLLRTTKHENSYHCHPSRTNCRRAPVSPIGTFAATSQPDDVGHDQHHPRAASAWSTSTATVSSREYPYPTLHSRPHDDDDHSGQDLDLGVGVGVDRSSPVSVLTPASSSHFHAHIHHA